MGTQLRDIQHPEQGTEADLECVRETVPSQGQRNLQGRRNTCARGDVQTVNKD